MYAVLTYMGLYLYILDSDYGSSHGQMEKWLKWKCPKTHLTSSFYFIFQSSTSGEPGKMIDPAKFLG